MSNNWTIRSVNDDGEPTDDSDIRLVGTATNSEGGGAFEDTDGDDVAELQSSHADMQGGDVRNAGSLGADSTRSATLSAQVVVYKDSNGTIHAVRNEPGNLGEIDSGSNAATVIQNAVDDLNGNDGGTVFIRRGEYIIDSQISATGKGVQLRGEGAPWYTAGEGWFGTVFRAASGFASNTSVLNLDAQFQGMRFITVDCNSNADRGVRAGGNRDITIVDCGMLNANKFNLFVSTTNLWVQRNWIEFADIAGCYIAGGGDHLWIDDNIFTNSDADIWFATSISDSKFRGNKHENTNEAFNVTQPVTGSKIANNDYIGIGQNGTNKNVVALEADATDLVFAGNTVEGNDNTGTQQTRRVFDIVSGVAVDDLRIDNSPASNLSQPYIRDNGASPARYARNGLGFNDGDPASTGTWNGEGYEGLTVRDRANNDTYKYNDGVWSLIAST